MGDSLLAEIRITLDTASLQEAFPGLGREDTSKLPVSFSQPQSCLLILRFSKCSLQI